MNTIDQYISMVKQLLSLREAREQVVADVMYNHGDGTRLGEIDDQIQTLEKQLDILLSEMDGGKYED